MLQNEIPAGYLEREADRARASRALVDTLVALHASTSPPPGLADFGRPDGYLERQLRRWRMQWDANRTAPLPEIEALLARLSRAPCPPAPTPRSCTATSGSEISRSTRAIRAA